MNAIELQDFAEQAQAAAKTPTKLLRANAEMKAANTSMAKAITYVTKELRGIVKVGYITPRKVTVDANSSVSDIKKYINDKGLQLNPPYNPKKENRVDVIQRIIKLMSPGPPVKIKF